MNTLLHFLLCQSVTGICYISRSLRSVHLGGPHIPFTGSIKWSYHGWLNMTTSSEGPFSLASDPSTLIPPLVKPPRKTKIIHFTTKQNNIQAFVNLPIRPIILFCGRQYFFQEVFVRLYFLVKTTPGKVDINFTGDKAFHILLQHSVSLIRPQYYSYWLSECLTGTFWMTERDAGT